MSGEVIWLTGVGGFLGGHLAETLAGAGLRTVGLYHRHPPERRIAERFVASAAADLGSPEAAALLLTLPPPGVIIHAAALSNPKLCEDSPSEAHQSNTIATRALTALSAEQTTSPLFIYISTDLVFDGAPPPPPAGFGPSAPPCARSLYAQTKLRAEELVLALPQNAKVLRSSLIYGPPINDATGFLGWLRNGVTRGEKVTLFTDEFRTPVYVDDLSRVVLALCRLHREGQLPTQPEIYHTGGPDRLSRYDFGRIAAEVFGWSSALLQPARRAELALRPPRPEDVSLDSRSTEERLGVRFRDIRSGLEALRDAEKSARRGPTSNR